ncbi:MAG TPA: TonB-dependent receptor, partial [Sphingomicrobium sp.]|nr:TonB-dependent receptor [Sphingomicrobium sp.]
MRIRLCLLIGTAAAAISSPSFAQTPGPVVPQQTGPTEEEAIAQVADERLAQTSGDDIIVTATKRASTVQDVPFSVNAQTQQDIQRANAQTLEDLSRNVAGLTVQNLGPGQSQVSIRGVSAGQIVRDQPGVKEQVGVYLDESVTSLSLFTPDFDLFDLNRVETLRGPQGTLFGSGSVGGTIRYITNQPRLGITEGLIEGNVNTVDESDIGYHLKGAINVPLGPTAAIRAVAYGTHYAGFIDAVGPAGGKNVNDGRRVGGRIALLWEPAPNIRITPRVVYQEVRANGFNREERYNFYTTFTTEPDVGKRMQYLKLREKFSDDTLLADLVASVAFGGVELTSVTSYLDRDILVSRDASALTGSVGIVPLVGCCGVNPAIANLPSNLRDTTDLSQWTQEVRLASINDSPFQWVIGAFYTDIDRTYMQRLPTPGYDAFIDAAPAFAGFLPGGISAVVANGFPLNSPYNADLPYDISQKALFGEATYDFGQFKLTGGARFYDFKETRDFISGGLFSNGDTRIGDETKSDGISPRIIGTWEPNRNLSVNVQAAKGFRLGGINDPLNITLCSAEDELIYGPFQSNDYSDETLWNYEAGVKYSRAGITFNAAVFHTRIKDLQVTVDAGSCSSRIVLNVEKAHTTGIEAEFAANPAPGLDLSVAASLLEAEFDSSVPEPLATRTGIRDGNRLPSVPKFQIAATASYGQRLNSNADWYVNGSFQHVGNRFTQPGDQEAANENFNFIFFDPNTNAFGTINQHFGSLRLPSYNLVNLSAGIEWDSGLEVVAYVKNLFDENPLLSLDRERGGRARIGYNVGQPRMIGLTVRQSFGWAPPPPPPP